MSFNSMICNSRTYHDNRLPAIKKPNYYRKHNFDELVSGVGDNDDR